MCYLRGSNATPRCRRPRRDLKLKYNVPNLRRRKELRVQAGRERRDPLKEEGKKSF